MPAGPFAPERLPARMWLWPLLSTLAGSACALLPIVAQMPLFPPMGLLVALGWRLLRPEMWPAWIALPLGLADDLIGGAPIGTAMMLWTIAFLALDAADQRLVWRDSGESWRLAAGAIAFCIVGAWLVARLTGGAGPWWVPLVQIVPAVLLFPLVARACAAIDRRRLRRGRGAA